VKFSGLGLKLYRILLGTFAVLAMPFFSVYHLILRIIRKVSKSSKSRLDKVRKANVSYSARFLRDYWFGETEKAQNNRVFYWFLFPALGSFLLFVIVPFLQGLYLSMTNWTGLNTGREVFIGLANYSKIFSDYRFIFSFFRTFSYSVLNIIVINVVAFLLALLVTQNLKLKNVYRAGFFMPNLIGGLVLGYIWQFIYNRALTSLGGAFATSLLQRGDTALVGLIVVVTWQYAGYIMMIYIAAIQNIPQDLVEASTIDGANAFQKLRTITFPLVAQAFTVAMFLTLITSFKQFDTVMSLTQGGPPMILPEWFGNLFGLTTLPVVNSTNLVAINIYQTAFTNYSLGEGQAKAIVFFAILLIVSLVQVQYNKKKEVEF
jgi:raffinose/stachyose/melibiose transport system permease protein